MGLPEPVQNRVAEREGMRKQEDPGGAVGRRGQKVQSSHKGSAGGGSLELTQNKPLTLQVRRPGPREEERLSRGLTAS